MNPFDCEFVMIGGYWLPAVADLSRTPVYIGDYDRAYSGVLRTAHVGKARTWRVLLQGVPSEEVPMVEEILRSPEPVGCNIMGEECIASVTEISSVHDPIKSGPRTDWGRMNYEIQIEETWAEHVLPGYSYEYQAFFDTGPFVWDWEAAGFPNEVDVLMVAGGGGGGAGSAASSPDPDYGGGGGGAGGVSVTTGVPVSGNVSGSVGAGGTQGNNGQNTTFGSLPAVIGGGRGGGSTSAGSGGSGGGAVANAAPGAGTPGQGHAGYRGSRRVDRIPGGGISLTRRAGGGGGAGEGDADTIRRHGGSGVDLLALGWNYRLVPGTTRYVGGGGGGGGGATGAAPRGEGGVGGGGAGAPSNAPASPGAPNTGGGGGGGSGTTHPGAPGGSGLVIVRWLVNP